MNSKWKKILSILVTVLVLFPFGVRVTADDHDDHDDDKKHEYFQKDNDDDDDDDDNDNWRSNPQKRQANSIQQTEYWNIWSREPRNDPTNTLPIENPGELIVIVNGHETNIYCVPKDGQLLISAAAIAEILDVHATFYPQSKIAVLGNGKLELIVKAGSNAAFENRSKMPMPTEASFYENAVYLPISVAANALGYRVSWDIDAQALVLQSI